ncbi:MAG TPA: hypothetical protein V6D03_08445, partial [Candidatus Caenarcaniphilales bacterium]
MRIPLRRPILTGAIGLTLTVWVLDLFGHWFTQSFKVEAFSIIGLGVVAFGASLWTRRKPLIIRPQT